MTDQADLDLPGRSFVAGDATPTDPYTAVVFSYGARCFHYVREDGRTFCGSPRNHRIRRIDQPQSWSEEDDYRPCKRCLRLSGL